MAFLETKVRSTLFNDMSVRTALPSAAQEVANPEPAANPDVQQVAPTGNEAPPASARSQLGGNIVDQLKADLNKFANENQTVSAILGKLEQSTNLPREKLVLAVTGGLTALVSIYLLVGAGAAFVCNVLIGVAYPATASLRALKAQDRSQDNQLLAYWSIFGALLLVDSLLREVPTYFLLKAAALLALSLPQIRGAEVVHAKVLEPAMAKLDALLQKKSE